MTPNLFRPENRMSSASIKAVDARREQLTALIERMKSSQLQDIEAALANISHGIQDLSEHHSKYRCNILIVHNRQ